MILSFSVAVVVCLFSVSQVTACQERLAPHADMQFGCSRLRDKSAAVQALEPGWDEEVRSLPLCLAISLARISTFSRLGHSSCAKVSVTRMREAAGRRSGAVGCAGGGAASSFGEMRICQRDGKTNRGPAGRRSITAVSQGRLAEVPRS